MTGAKEYDDTICIVSVIRSKQLRSKRQLGKPFPTAHDAASLRSISEAGKPAPRLHRPK